MKGAQRLSVWQPSPFLVKRARRESDDTVTLYLAPVDGENRVAPETQPWPGQFNMIYLFGHGEAPVSISGVSRSSGNLQHTVKAAGPLTRALTELQAGDLVGLRGPYGNGWPLKESRGRNLLLVAGGIGMAPIRAVTRELLRHRGRFGRVDLVYGSRTPEDVLYRAQLARWTADGSVNVHLTVDHGGAHWQGAVGFVTTQLEQLDLQPALTTAFLCGPEIMMRHTMSQLIDMKVEAKNIFMSMERNMRCAIGVCGHCQWGKDFLCQQGPVFAAGDIRDRLQIREL